MKLFKRALLIGLAVVFTLGLGGCEEFLALLETTSEILLSGQPEGAVIDARTGSGISGVELTLTYEGGLPADKEPSNAFTGTSGTDGSFTIGSDVPYARYRLEGEKTGYVFIPQTIELNETTLQLPEMVGFESDAGSLDVSFVVMWSDTFDDVDAYFSYPKDATVDGLYSFGTPYDDPTSAPLGFVATQGASTAISNRVQVYWGRASSASDATGYMGKGTADFDSNDDGTIDSYRVEVDVDDQNGRGPETITMRRIPFDYLEADGNSTYGGGVTGLPELTGGDYYTWVGSAQLYVDAYDEDTTTDGQGGNLSAGTNGANVVVYAIQGDDILGEYRVPGFTTTETASILRVNMFYIGPAYDSSWYQIVQDGKLIIDDATTVGLDVASVSEIVGTFGPGRD